MNPDQGHFPPTQSFFAPSTSLQNRPPFPPCSFENQVPAFGFSQQPPPPPHNMPFYSPMDNWPRSNSYNQPYPRFPDPNFRGFPAESSTGFAGQSYPVQQRWQSLPRHNFRVHQRPVPPLRPQFMLPNQAGSSWQFQKMVKPESVSPEERIVQEFLENRKSVASVCSSTPSMPEKPRKFLKISEAQSLLVRAKELIEKLEESCNPEYKTELSNIVEVMQDKDVMDDLKTKIDRRRKKRSRIKENRQRDFEAKQAREQRIKEKSAEIEKWLKLEKEKFEQELREADMQRQIDESLAEVRKEQSATNRQIELTNQLAKLRKARLVARKSRGDAVPQENVTSLFNETILRVKSRLNNLKQSWDEKASSLRLFIEAEQKQAKEEIEKKRLRAKDKKRREWEAARNVALFGETKEVGPFDCMWPVQEVHKQASLSLSNLIHYRQLWDRFIDEEGSTIPVDWVEPQIPSSSEWASFIDETNNL